MDFQHSLSWTSLDKYSKSVADNVADESPPTVMPFRSQCLPFTHLSYETQPLPAT